MQPSLSIAAQTALACGLVTVAMAGLTVAFHGVMRWRAQRLEDDIQSLAGSFARYLTGRVATGEVRARSTAAPGEAFWGAIQRFADNITGDEWLGLSQQLGGLRHLRVERGQLDRGTPWRQAVAARRLGMIDVPETREALRAALNRDQPEVRLRALLSLARLQDDHALRWLLQHREAVDHVAPSIVLATLKRFGPGFTPEIQTVLSEVRPAGRLVVAAAEVLGFWRDSEARIPLERLLGVGDLEERIAAARALGNLGIQHAGRALIEALQDPAWQVRAQAARSLGRLAHVAALAPLEARTTDMAWWVRRNASYALAELGPPGVSALCGVAASSQDRYAREMAVEVLQAIEWEHLSPGGIGRVG